MVKDKASPFRNAAARYAAGRMGMFLFLASLAMLFVAGLVGYGIIRINAPAWPVDLPHLPRTLLISTALLAISSGSIQLAFSSARSRQLHRATWLMLLTLALGAAFLFMQLVAWFSWLSDVADWWAESEAYRWALTSFYVLTGIHALHVLGGLIPIAVSTVTIRRRAAKADSDEASTTVPHAGIHYCALYWHFLGIVWLVLYLVLLIGT